MKNPIALTSTSIQDMAKGAFWAIFCIYSLYQTLVFMHYQAMVPDEYWFLKEAKNFSVFSRSAPPLDYGSLFWFLLKLLHFPFIIRAVFLLLFLSIPCLLLTTLENPETRLAGLLVYLSFPYAFWTGKLISPELPYLATMACALFFLKKNTAISGISAGIAAGIKINALPMLAFLILMQPNDMPIKNAMRLGMFFVLGLIISNPVNLDLYLSHVLQANKTSDSLLDWQRIQAIFVEPLWSWDNILLRSFSQMLCHPVLFLGFMMIIMAGSRLIGSALLIFSVASVYLVVKSQFAFAWYWFPLVPVMLYSLKAIDRPTVFTSPALTSPEYVLPHSMQVPKLSDGFLSIRQYGFVSLILIFALCNFFINLPNSIFQAYEKFAQIHFIQQYPQACLAHAFDSYQPEDIINKMEFGYALPKPDFGFSLPKIPTDSVVLPHYNSSIDTSRRTMIIIGRRMLANPMNFSTMLPKNYPIKLYDICGDLFIFVNQ